MNDSKNSSNGLLVLKLKSQVSDECIADLTEVIRPTADALDVEPMVLPVGVDVELHTGSQALLERVCVALEEIAAQGRMPEVSEAQIAPQALNARPTGLNSRPIGSSGEMSNSSAPREGQLGHRRGAFSHADDQPPPTLPEDATFPLNGPIGSGLNTRG